MDTFSFAEAFRRLRRRCPAAAALPCVQALEREQVMGAGHVGPEASRVHADQE
jgi:hypothetical protein